MLTYKEQIAHPKWQKKRLEILQRDNFTCQICLDTETQLHIHHQYYDKTFQTMAWEYPNHAYKTLCADCHKAITVHLEEYGNDKEFSVLKLKSAEGVAMPIVYTNGSLKFNCELYNNIEFDEKSTYQIVQFLINNWCKNG